MDNTISCDREAESGEDALAQNKRTFPGEDEARFLLGLINDGRMIDREFLKRLVTALQAAGQVRPVTPVTRKRLESGDAGVKAEADLLKPVNALIRARGYLAFPTVQPGPRIVWRNTPESATSKGQTRGAADLELHAALFAVSLARQGRISRLKQCTNCPRWFFAKFEHQRFCSQSCKDLFHRDHPADRERRRVWARENYRSRLTVESGSSKFKKVK
jgi:hypothetical protein